MKSLNNEVDSVPTVYLLSSDETCSTSIVYIQLSCCPKGFHRNPQSIQPDAKTIGCFPQTTIIYQKQGTIA